MFVKNSLIFLTTATLFLGCENSDTASNGQLSGEYILRSYNDLTLKDLPPQRVDIAPYPWEEGHQGAHPKITKEFFRCKGSTLNPGRVLQDSEEANKLFDCGGSEAHSLPLSEGKEFIYPILLQLLNELQRQTGKKVIVTSGHRCPEHNAYVDSSKENRFSKHQLGAEVSFYLQGAEAHPEKIIGLLQKYYQETPKYLDSKDYLEFKRWEKPTDIATQPWYNKEIFIKLYQKNEGRNFDNRHPYPYVSIQVRYDFDTKQRVQYSWDKAFSNYMRL